MELCVWLCSKWLRLLLNFPFLLPWMTPQILKWKTWMWYLNEKHECPPFSLKVRDYSGTYTVKLLPCTTPSNQEYRLPVTCNPREPVTFDLDIRFQQVCLLHLFSHDFSNPTLWRSWLTCISKKKEIHTMTLILACWEERKSDRREAREEEKRTALYLPLVQDIKSSV